MTQLSFLDDQQTDIVSWTGARNPALNRLNKFLPRAGKVYASNRNYDFGPQNRSNISCLSPWIRHRLILEEDVVKATLKRHSLSGAEKFLQEVFWRSYFKGWLEQRPSVWLRYRIDLERLIDELERASTLRGHYEAAINGATGISCFDAWTRELIDTGYLHNHTRMWFASIWIFTLQLPWQLGADFFYRHLLDGDPASNTLSWRWVAGLHTKGKIYLARTTNIEKYTNGRFSPRELVSNASPFVDDFDHPLKPLSVSNRLACDEPFGLLITEEDCSVETLSLAGNPKGVAGLLATDSRSPFEVGAPAQTFAADAMNDALGRAGAYFERNTYLSNTEDWSHFLVQWAEEMGVKTIVTAWLPVGPIKDKLDRAGPALTNSGIRILQIKRHYDDACWPHASRGFFKLKAKIPNLIDHLMLNKT